MHLSKNFSSTIGTFNCLALFNCAFPLKTVFSLAKTIEVSSEIDEMWSYVEKKSNPRWLWHAIDHKTGQVLAYVFGQRKDEVFLELKELLQPFGISRFYTDNWGACAYAI